MSRGLPVVAALAASLLLASCGGGASGSGSAKPPQGPPSARHPASALTAELAGEEMRAHLLVAARLYNNFKYALSAAHIAAAQQEYPAALWL